MKLRVAKKVLRNIYRNRPGPRYHWNTADKARRVMARRRRRLPLFLLDGHGKRLAPGKPVVYLSFDLGPDHPPVEVLDTGMREIQWDSWNRAQTRNCNSAGDPFTQPSPSEEL